MALFSCNSVWHFHKNIYLDTNIKKSLSDQFVSLWAIFVLTVVVQIMNQIKLQALFNQSFSQSVRKIGQYVFAYLMIVPSETELLRRCTARRCATKCIHTVRTTLVNGICCPVQCVQYKFQSWEKCVRLFLSLYPVHSVRFWSTENKFSSLFDTLCLYWYAMRI